MTLNIAVIGAGLSGLVVANQLKDKANVTVFEKARGVGGRMATRYADPYQFDHGAQFFTVKTKAFQNFLEPYLASGTVQRWDADFVEFSGSHVTCKRKWDAGYPHYVAAPKMNALCKELSISVNVKLSCRITKIEKYNDFWCLTDDAGHRHDGFDWLIITAPAAQAYDLLPDFIEEKESIKNIPMVGCYSLMLGFEQAIDLPFEAALVKDADISWISVNSSKPGRPEGFALLIHATNSWAEAHMEDAREDITAHLLTEASRVTGQDLSTACHVDLHRWRYANIDKQDGEMSICNHEHKLGICGDWFIQGRVEAAFTSAIDFIQKSRLG